jgi:hypothetical protein
MTLFQLCRLYNLELDGAGADVNMELMQMSKYGVIAYFNLLSKMPP